jgi:hypothetical protein
VVNFLRIFGIRSLLFATLSLSAFASYNVHQFFLNHHILAQLTPATFYWIMILAFVAQMFLFYIYLYFGLMAVIAFHFAVNIRFLIYALLF